MLTRHLKHQEKGKGRYDTVYFSSRFFANEKSAPQANSLSTVTQPVSPEVDRIVKLVTPQLQSVRTALGIAVEANLTPRLTGQLLSAILTKKDQVENRKKFAAALALDAAAKFSKLSGPQAVRDFLPLLLAEDAEAVLMLFPAPAASREAPGPYYSFLQDSWSHLFWRYTLEERQLDDSFRIMEHCYNQGISMRNPALNAVGRVFVEADHIAQAETIFFRIVQNGSVPSATFVSELIEKLGAVLQIEAVQRVYDAHVAHISHSAYLNMDDPVLASMEPGNVEVDHIVTQAMYRAYQRFHEQGPPVVMFLKTPRDCLWSSFGEARRGDMGEAEKALKEIETTKQKLTYADAAAALDSAAEAGMVQFVSLIIGRLEAAGISIDRDIRRAQILSLMKNQEVDAAIDLLDKTRTSSSIGERPNLLTYCTAFLCVGSASSPARDRVIKMFQDDGLMALPLSPWESVIKRFVLRAKLEEAKSVLMLARRFEQSISESGYLHLAEMFARSRGGMESAITITQWMKSDEIELSSVGFAQSSIR